MSTFKILLFWDDTVHLGKESTLVDNWVHNWVQASLHAYLLMSAICLIRSNKYTFIRRPHLVTMWLKFCTFLKSINHYMTQIFEVSAFYENVSPKLWLKWLTFLIKWMGSQFFQNSNHDISHITCKGHEAVVSLSAGDDMRPAEA